MKIKMLCKHDYYRVALLEYHTEEYKVQNCTLRCKKCNKRKEIRYKERKEL